MVKEKRKRGVPYLDSVDLEILELLDSPNWNVKKDLGGWSVLDIVEKLEIQHNNLKPHIDKLLKLNLICLKDLSEYKNRGEKNIKIKKVGLTSIRVLIDRWIEDDVMFMSDEELIKAKADREYFKNVVKCLSDVRKYFWDKEQKDFLELDLRSIETQDRLLNTKIGTLTEDDNKKISKKKNEIKKIIKNSRKKRH
jgi:hypothetical protein